MKIAILADIHGNGPALEAVLSAARATGVERLLIAGDIVGYYYAAGHVLDHLADWSWVAVRGNHEDMLGDWMANRRRDEIRARYGSGLESACDDLSADQLQMLCNLPPVRTLGIDERQVVLCHGTPTSTDTYIYPDADDDSWSQFFLDDAHMTIYGHTHYPVIQRRDGTSVVNPGSVGQPRDRKPGACWALWDSEADTIELRREAYDPSALIAQCRQRDPDLPYLADVLTRTV